MGNDSHRPWSTPGFELIERPAVTGWDVWPELVRPIARLRSPIMDHRPRPTTPPDEDRVMVMLPAARDIIRPMAWATLIALPVLALIGWQAALVVGGTAAFIRAVDCRIARSELSFASGFIGYRPQVGLPHGVREDDDVRWNWSKAQGGQGA
jgi:hypothetical protein